MLGLKDGEVLIIRIKENSFRARIAGFNLKVKSVAMVWGTTILLFNVTKEEFLQDREWVCHEVRHVLQSRAMGKWRFLLRYAWISIKTGYEQHPYEVNARLHARDYEILDRVIFV